MSDQNTPALQHLFRYQRFNIKKSQPLGHGSYGAVYKAKCDQLPCAAKVLHPTILDPRDPGADKIMDRFSQECALLESIRHPNIVQYLGVTVDPESRLPVLLMELLDGSLTKLLEHSQQSLTHYIQVDICHDIALAIAYLHSNNIIHRDLSSNNVLIIAERRAKVTDFGMSKLAGAAPTMTPLTMCPGTLAYMPPEALREPPRYTKKLDCFSEGVIMIQVCTRLWPEPGPRTQTIQDSRSPTGIMEMPIPETERRKNHIDLIDPKHPVLPIAVDCLYFQEMARPSSEELCQRLAGLRESTEYRESVEQQEDEISMLTQQLRQNEKSLQEKDTVLQQKEIQHQEEMALQERQLRRLNQQLEVQEQVTAEIQQTNLYLQRQVEQLQQQLSRHKRESPQPLPSSCLQLDENLLRVKPSFKELPEQWSAQVHLQSQPPKGWKMTLSWRDGGNAPFEMSRGATVVDGDVAYFMGCNGRLCSYNSTSRKWSELPECPYICASLEIVNGQLTAIGGCRDVFSKQNCTNKLLSLRESWLDIFPPMPTKRRGTTAVTSKEHLIVAGGSTGLDFADNINTVEVMDTKTLVWSTVASLPHPYCFASTAICGDNLYMLGGNDDKNKTKSVLTCSLTELLQSSSSPPPSVWHRVADAPVYRSTCVVVNGQDLLAVGGCDKSLKAMATIHQYNPTTNTWNHITNMPTARYACVIAVLSTIEILAVGGCVSLVNKTDTVEIAEIK